MPRHAQLTGAPVLGAVLVLAALACRPGQPAQSVVDAGVQVRAAAPPQIPLTLPTGWEVNAGADGVVRASSPRGHLVLRAEVQRGVGMPTPTTLRTGFLGGLKHLRARSESVSEGPGFIAMRFVLADPDGGAPETAALLSATKLGDDTLLCATLPAATREELDAAEAACHSAGTPSGR